MTLKLAILISGSGSNLQAILDAIQARRLQAQVALVVSNRPQAYGLTRAAAAQIPTAVHRLRPYLADGRGRQAYDADLAALVRGVGPDWIVLAGWMHILSRAFLQAFPNRVINLHPALPGQFPGTHAIERAYAASREQGLQETGVMVHLVPDAAVDAGPLLASQRVPIRPDDTLESLTARIQAAEHGLLVQTLIDLAEQSRPGPQPTPGDGGFGT